MFGNAKENKEAKIKILHDEPCALTLAVELPQEEVVRETETVFRDIQARVSLPGFRLGRAPMDLIRQHFSSKARSTVIENLVTRSVPELLKAHAIEMVNAPRVEKIEFQFDRPLSFQIKVEREPKVKVKDYKGIKIAQRRAEVTDSKAQEAVDELRERNAVWVDAGDTELGRAHLAVVDYTGRLDDAPIPGGQAQNQMIDMSAPQTLVGFTDGLLGARKGETREVAVTFPSDYPQGAMAGKSAQFTVTLKEIKKKKVPAADDEFAKDLGLGSLDALKAKARQNLEMQAQKAAEIDLENQIHQALLGANHFPVPPSMVLERTQSLIGRALRRLQAQGLSESREAFQNPQWQEQFRPEAERQVRLYFILRAVAQQEKLEATEVDVAAAQERALRENPEQRSEIETYFQKNLETVKSSLTEENVLKWIKAHAKIREVSQGG